MEESSNVGVLHVGAAFTALYGLRLFVESTCADTIETQWTAGEGRSAGLVHERGASSKADQVSGVLDKRSHDATTQCNGGCEAP